MIILTAQDMPYQSRRLLAYMVTSPLLDALMKCRQSELDYEQANQAKYDWRNPHDIHTQYKQWMLREAGYQKLLSAERKAKKDLYAARRELGLVAVKWALQEGVIDG